MQQFREYKTDADKVRVYDGRLRQARQELDRIKPTIEEFWRRYEASPIAGQQSAKGHNIATPDGTAVIDSLYSSLTAADVDVRVTATGVGSSDQEYLASEALGKEWDTCGVNEECGPAIKDSLVTGLGWVKVAYEYYASEQELPREDTEIAADIEKLALEARDNGHELEYAVIAQYVPLTKVESVVTQSRLVVDHVPWDQVLYDPTAKRLKDAKWYAQVTYCAPEEVRQNPVFRAYCEKAGTLKRLDNLRGDTTIDQSILGDVKPTEDDQRVTVYEMTDLETGTTCTLAKDSGFLLNEAPNPLAINDRLEDMTPFVPCVLRKTSTRARGVSEMEVMKTTLEELDLYHSKLATYLERMAPKYMAEEGSVTETGKAAFRSQEYGSVVEYKVGKTPPTAVQPPQLPSEVYNVLDKLKDSLRDSTGLNELLRGLFPDRKRTATETSEVVTASQARQAEKRVQLERFYTGVARRILQLMQMFYTDQRMVRYQDYEGPIEWSWTADDIVFETKLEIVLTPKEEKTRQALRDEGMALLNVFGPLTQTPDPTTGAPVVDQMALVRIVADKMGFSRRDTAMLLNLPAEQQAKALAAQQLQAGQQAAAAGVPRADMVPGPMDEKALAAATNAGTIPPEVLLAAQGVVPTSPGAVEQVSKSAGVSTP